MIEERWQPGERKRKRLERAVLCVNSEIGAQRED